MIKRELMFKDYENCLFNDKIILKSQQRFKSDCHNIYILNKSKRMHQVVMMIKDCKHLIKLQHIHVEQKHFKVCESKMLSKI